MNTPTRRLGRGLGSLIAGGGQSGTILTEPPESPEDLVPNTPNLESEAVENNESELAIANSGSNQLQELAIEQVFPNPHQPRKVIDPEAVRELANSIDTEGLLQPIVVRSNEHGYELIAGERRLRAHQYLGRSKILARVLEVTDLSSASLSLIENLQREELNPVEEAMGYQSLISDFNLNQQEVAQRMGKSRSHIANLIRLLQLDVELQRLLAQGELSVGHAKVLLGIEDLERRLSVGRKAVLEGWTVRQIEEAISAAQSLPVAPISRKQSSSLLYEDLAHSTALTTGRTVKIKASAKGKGTISLSFKDETDLRKLLAKIDHSSN